MAHVRDLWTSPNSDKNSRKKRVPNKRWGVGKRWQVRWEENGNLVSKTFDYEDAAREFCARVEVGQADGTWITKAKAELTLEDIWEPWLATKSKASAKTRRDYESLWAVHVKPVWGSMRCGDIHRPAVTAWLPTLTTMKGVPEGEVPRVLGSSQVRKIGQMMKSLLDMAEELGAINKNPLKSGDVPRQVKAERRYLKVWEIDAILDAAPTPASKLLLRVLLMTGLRPGEAKGLKVRDLDVARGRLAIRRDVDDLGHIGDVKTYKHRDVPIGGEVLQLLAAAADGRDDDAWLVPDEHGRVWTTARWRKIWATILIHTGIGDLDTYELRHTAASLAIAAGADVKTVQLMLGHSSATTTLDVYGHLWEEGLDTLPGAMDALMSKERERLATEAASREMSEAERRRARFKVIG